jgi:nicotinate-nucleotide pyrophosphorylase
MSLSVVSFRRVIKRTVPRKVHNPQLHCTRKHRPTLRSFERNKIT